MANLNLVPQKRRSNKPVRSWAPTVRFTLDERQQIDELRASESYSNYIRQAALKRRAPTQIPAVNQQSYTELSRLSANLNQLTKAVNTALKSGQPIPIDVQLLAELRTLIDQMRSDLIGLADQKSEP